MHVGIRLEMEIQEQDQQELVPVVGHKMDLEMLVQQEQLK